jgi:repressor LexA
MIKPKLTQRQKQVLELVNKHIKDFGYSPTLSELMDELDISTKKGVAFHLDALEKKGYLSRTGESRGIIISQSNLRGFLNIPLLGYANAGTPLALAKEEYIGELTVDEKIVKGRRKVFGLEIKGDSMDKKVLNGVPMFNGNYAIVAKDLEIEDGDVVLAVINDAATIKTYKKEGKNIVLYPESTNPVHRPIYIEDDGESFINGKVLTVLSNPTTYQVTS